MRLSLEFVLSVLALSANLAPAGEVTRIHLQGFKGYSGTHNWAHHTAPFTLVNLDDDPALEVMVKEWRDWSYRGRGSYARQNSVPARLYAFDHDGTPLWVFDHGAGVNVGVNFAPTLAADLDGDGSAEVYTRKAEDRRAHWPKMVLTEPGHDWLVRLDPATGEETARAAWPPHHRYPGNSQLLIGYLDGASPALIVCGGFYGKQMTIRAFKPDLTLLWEASSGGGHGAHAPSCADVDGDGRDEVILGSAVLDDNGSLLWKNGLGHVDLAVVADIDWSEPGLEILYGSQNADFTGVVRGADGKTLWSKKQKTHSQEGCGEFDAERPGLECFGWQDKKDGYDATRINMWDAKGQPLDPADYFAEMPGGKGGTLYLWWRGGRALDTLGTAGVPKASFMRLVGDLQGDWREEVAWIEKDEIVLCSPAGKPLIQRPSLRQDRKYRAELARGSSYFAQTHYTRPMPARPVHSNKPAER